MIGRGASSRSKLAASRAKFKMARWIAELGRVRGEMSIKDAVNLAQEAGRKYITVANSILGAG